MNQDTAPPLPARLIAQLRQPLVWGTFCGLAAAIGYTAANIFLRSAKDCDPIWVSCVKSVPTVLLAGPWLLFNKSRGETILPAPRVLGSLMLAGLIGQLFGNVGFQWALGVIGMALTVPITMGTIILAGAVMGRIFLHEPVTWRAAVSMSVLVLAICVLSLGAGAASRSVIGADTTADVSVAAWRLFAAVAAACVSGVAYAALGVVIRHGVSGRASVATTLFAVGVVGSIALGTLSTWRLGWNGMAATSAWHWQQMLLAGVCNFVAFLALTKALQLATVVYVNALNTSQVAMAAVAGVLIFQESPSVSMWTGVGLTVVGLILMSSRKKK
ncbi:MAG: DMT family transporter [Planctomycetales bacterium]|nr:DMT family transporter [Planctomycetales bacterium]